VHPPSGRADASLGRAANCKRDFKLASASHDAAEGGRVIVNWSGSKSARSLLCDPESAAELRPHQVALDEHMRVFETALAPQVFIAIARSSEQPILQLARARGLRETNLATTGGRRALGFPQH
jgi:hypothetical protein